jgi:2-ketocyclohexanecarboxyl-CoA hydrolase
MQTEFRYETSVDYPVASVRFQLSLNCASGINEPSFKLTAQNLSTGQPIPFNHLSCPAVHDFTRGYTRWLFSKGIQASRGEAEITGTTKSKLSLPQLCQLVHNAVDMIDQRFSNYKHSIIDSNVYSDIIFEKHDGVAWLMINRPETYNAKRGITMNEMADALLNTAADPSIRVVVISGAGPNGFCTGNDQSYDPDLEKTDYSGTAEVRYSEILRGMPQPVIAAVDGFAVGSGNILAYLSDFTIATSRSRFGQTGPRVGSPAASHRVAQLSARIGQKRAREIWMLCRLYSANEAYDMGLVNKVVEPEHLWAEVERWIKDIKNVSPVILQMQKIAFNQYDDHILPEKSPIEEFIPDYHSSEECRERRLAFVERRPIDPSKNIPYAPVPIK